MKKTIFIFSVLIFIIGVSISCQKVKPKPDLSDLPDYEDLNSWLSNPTDLDHNVDVFYVYPTIFGGINVMNMDISVDSLRERAIIVSKQQASVFTEDCNLFAPFYRQMAMDGLSMPPDSLNKYFTIGYEDVKRAFDYYLNNLNNGRPFIIAGHSQGSMALIRLMKEVFNNSQVRDNLVAAYIIGYSIVPADLENYPWLKIAQSSDDVGVIITYNTQSVDATDSPVLLDGAQCVNPLNWKTTRDTASKSLNLGAAFFNANGDLDSIEPEFTAAWIDEKGALVAGDVDVEEYSKPPTSFPRGVYHKYDYSFFYENLKKNVGERVAAFYEK